MLGIFAAAALAGIFIFAERADRPIQTPLLYNPAGLSAVVLPPFGVMIENELLARPFQKGLSRASRVYEALAEGGITRFLAIFPAEALPDRIGPVRSVRNYFIDWMAEYDGVLVHVGGSADAQARLFRERKLKNADQFFLEKYFWRENEGKIALEHTMVTSAEKLLQLVQDQKWIAEAAEREIFAEEDEIFDINDFHEPADTIFIDFGYPTYRVSYDYDFSAGRYFRSQARKPHIDQLNNEQLSAETIVLQRVKVRDVGDAALHIVIKTVDEGDGMVFYRGRGRKITWRKENADAPTRFFDFKTREEITLPENGVWFEILPSQNKFSYECIWGPEKQNQSPFSKASTSCATSS